MKRADIILVGGGGHCKSVIEAAESAGMRIHGILDLPEMLGKKVLNYEVIGTDDDIARYAADYEFVVTMGCIKDFHRRKALCDKVEKAGGRFATVIAHSAQVSAYAEVGAGSVVLHGACVNADAKIGKNCIINTLANIEHGVEVGDNSHISTGVMVNGECKIGENTFIGSGSVVVNGVSIPAGSFVKAHSLVKPVR